MKTLGNFLIIVITALFFVPKVIYTPEADKPNFDEITSYYEPYIVTKNKQEIELIKGEIRILVKEIQLKKSYKERPYGHKSLPIQQ